MVAALGVFLAVLPTLASCRVQPQATDSSWAPARETPALDQAAQFAVNLPPEPTTAPAHPRDFLKRDFDDPVTCGYDPFDSDPLYCYGACHGNNTNSIWGCCSIYEGDTTCYQTEPTTCIDFDWDSTTMSTSTCDYYSDTNCDYRRNYETLYCSHNSMWSRRGYCMTYLSASSDTTYSSFLCGNVNTAIEVSASEFYTTTDWDDDYSYYWDSSTTSTTRTRTSTTRTRTSTGTETGTAVGSIATLTEEDMDRQRSGTVGAIVGGVVGGIALVGAVTVAVVFLVMRRRSDNRSLSSEKQAAFAGGEGGAIPTRGSNESPVAPQSTYNPAPRTAAEGAAATSDPIPANASGRDGNSSANARYA